MARSEQRPGRLVSNDSTAHRWPIFGRALVLAFCGGALACSVVACSTIRPFLPESMRPTGPQPLVGSTPADSLTDEQIERRLAFITHRLEDGPRHASFWQYGWLTVNGGGMIASSVQAGLDTGNDQVSDIMEAGKGLIGTVYRLVQPLPGWNGAAPIRAMPDATHADKIARLLRGEEILRKAAARSRERTSWVMHGGNMVLNLITGAVLLGLDAPDLAAMSFFLDTAVGEVQIWTQPWQPKTDWEDYKYFVETGQAAPPPPVSYHIAPTGKGAALLLRF